MAPTERGAQAVPDGRVAVAEQLFILRIPALDLVVDRDPIVCLIFALTVGGLSAKVTGAHDERQRP